MSHCRFVRLSVIVGGVLWLYACSPQDQSSAVSARADTDTQSQSSATDLADYLGQYPFNDEVSTPFLQLPIVRSAVEIAVSDAAIQSLVLDSIGPRTPIFDISEAGDQSRIASWGCEAHNCGPHNWTLVINRDGSQPEVCYHHPDMFDEGARWFRPGQEPLVADFQCPGERGE